MTPRQFLEAVVRPNVDALHADTASVRHAYNAISAVDALAAHLYVWAANNVPEAVAKSKTTVITEEDWPRQIISFAYCEILLRHKSTLS